MIGRRRALRQLTGTIGGLGLLVSCDHYQNRAEIMQLSSPAFAANGVIPAEFTCEGADHSPALSWGAPPPATQSLTLVLTDLDTSPPAVHWVLYDLPPATRSLSAAIPTQPFLSAGVQGKNDFGQYGYRGPCAADQHRYAFKLYAVDTVLDLPPGTTYPDVMAALEGQILAEAELIGRYTRQR